jgi:carbon-monoxide dehydrogenase medium subunit
MLRQFKYLAPTSEEELLKLLAIYGEKAKLLAGGTNVFVDIRSDLQRPEYVVDVKKIPGVKDISFIPGTGLTIGAAVTCNEIIENNLVKEKYPLLLSAARELASYQIRNRATVTGNICYGSPAADMAPALLILDARLTVLSIAGEELISLKNFFKGVKKTALEPGDFVKSIIVPEEYIHMKALYKKSKRVKGHDLSIAGVAMGKIRGVFRIAIGSCGPTPILLDEIPVSTPLSEITAKVIEAISPIDDLRGSAEYRKHMVEVYIKSIYDELGGNSR